MDAVRTAGSRPRRSRQARAALLAAVLLAACAGCAGAGRLALRDAGPFPTAPTAATGAATPAPASLPAAPPEPLPAPRAVEEAIAQVKRATALVRTSSGLGSGISLGGGAVLTTHHVIAGARWIMVRFASGQQGPATVARADARRDLALLQTAFAEEPAASLGDATTLQAPQELFAIGYPRADIIGFQDATVTRGVFSGRWRAPTGVWHVQTDTSVNPGNSGGPWRTARGVSLAW